LYLVAALLWAVRRQSVGIVLMCVRYELMLALHSDADSTADGVANAVTLAAPDADPHSAAY
jgi:hypothetical protein